MYLFEFKFKMGRISESIPIKIAPCSRFVVKLQSIFFLKRIKNFKF